VKKPNEAVERLAYSPAEAAEALGIGMSKLNELMKSGEIEAVKHNGRVFVPADSPKKFLASLQKVSVA
jgi:excisionase family DNA binding protein